MSGARAPGNVRAGSLRYGRFSLDAPYNIV